VPKLNRRLFLFGGAAAGGALVLGVAGLAAGAAWMGSRDRVATQRDGLPDDGKGPLVALWLRLDEQGRLTVMSPHTEMGQGANTGLLQLVCDELDVDWEAASIELAPATPAFANGGVLEGFILGDGTPGGFVGSIVRNGFWTLGELMNLQITGGSASVRFTGWKTMRVAAAAAREVLVAAAASSLGVAASELTTASGHVVHAASGRRVPYGELVAVASTMELPSAPRLKGPDEWRYIGQRMPRVDIPDKVYAQATYGIDVQLDGMLHAAVVHPPHIGAEVTAVTNEAAILKRRGVHSVHIVPHGVAVVADNPWRAEQAVRAVTFDHTTPASASATTASLFQEMRDKLADDELLSAVEAHGDVQGAATDVVVESEFEVPYLAHAPMEPMNAAAMVEGDTVHVYVGTQNPLGCAANLAAFLEVDPGQVVVHGLTMGGGFGRRASIGSDQDHVNAAAQLARATGEPIKLLWSREADLRACHLRNGCVGRIRASANPDGTIATWDQRTYGTIHNAHEAVPQYPLANLRVRNVDEQQFVPFAYWRSVDASIYPFFVESMVDEVARAAGADPLEARLAMLPADSREARALNTVARMARWRTDVVDGRALGLALVRSFGSIVAQVAEVSLDGDVPTVHTVYVAADLGVAVNPDSVEAQLQGSVQFGLSAALYGRIDFVDGGVKQSNFHDYRVVRMSDAPDVEITLLSSPDAPVGGAGEPGVPPVAPAVANAMAVLGRRPRTLPIVG